MDRVSYVVTLGGCSWKLEVMPTGGWKNDTLLQLIVLCGIAVILLLVVLTISILFVDEQRKKFRRLSLTDSMTGLLNRNGFNLQLEEYLEGNKQKNCVGILLDVDNFKFINDVYGHTIGDQVLLQLSQSLVQDIQQGVPLFFSQRRRTQLQHFPGLCGIPRQRRKSL